MFVFGMDAEDVPVWREGKRHEWKDYDPRFVQALNMIMSGTFGDVDYFTVRAPAQDCIQVVGSAGSCIRSCC